MTSPYLEGQILDAMATYELAEMGTAVLGTGVGLAAAFGSETPDVLSGELPCSLGWITNARFEREFRGESLPGGTVWVHYTVARWYVVGTDQDSIGLLQRRGLPFVSKPPDCFSKHYQLGGTVYGVDANSTAMLVSYPVGDIKWVGYEHLFEVVAIHDRPETA